MGKSLFYFVFLSFVFQAAFADENDMKRKMEKSQEKLSVAVKIIDEDEADGHLKTEVTVNLNVTIEEDKVKVNGKWTELDVLTMYELDAEIEYSPEDIRISSVVVHVIVTRKELEYGHQYLIEEQVQFVEGKKVEQLDIQVLTIHMDVNGKEFKRTYDMISFEESRIKKTHLKRYCGKHDKVPKEVLKEPILPDESGLGHRGHHKRHHGKSLCSRFRKLPLGARVAILVGLVVVVLASILCCAVCCCRKSKGKRAYEIGKAEDFKAEFDIEEDQAEPLPEKLAFDDKEVLIA